MKNQIIEWLYVNDGKFCSKNEWRQKFIQFLNELEKTPAQEYTNIQELLEKK